ncbi:hypothetical protein I8748_31930 [Nostoc sp. CENA67]|uniref:Uncharacterized protein n=1 Tax=Amazonocrinis nigriterrae CENA67 TaxID=2794033 RepID=A0A8J7LBG8_9NOST|nr:hypothetical protein [Amazonocrinis nigriterrae]MBH8566708.1 hypothetical protein [Amazonocrinis nigriterrae CENA67]
MTEHKLFKHPNGMWKCAVCDWQWSSKPRTECPGVTRYDWGCHPGNLKDLVNLHKQNLKPKKDASPSGGIYSMKRSYWTWLYDVKDCELHNPKLPPIVQWDNLGELKTVGQLKKINLVPSEETKPRAVAWVWDKDEEWGVWIPLYHEDDCKWEARDNWITKTQLKEKYLLSDGWIKKIGEPDKLLDNPHYRNASRIKLYSRKRIEKFLADNAEQYAKWLDERDKYIAIFEANKDKIFAKRNLVKEQTKMCLKCASGCSLGKGFFCVIHPMGLLDMPCHDYQEKID